MPETTYYAERRSGGTRLLSPDEVADVLAISPRGVRLLAERHELPAVKVGKLWRIHPADLATYIGRPEPTP
jgi:excisionase family DNA binding protein